MKRILSLILAFVLMLTVFTACSKPEEKAKETDTPVESAEKAPEKAPEEKPTEPAEKTEEPAAKEPVEVGPIAKIGLGNIGSTGSSKDKADDKPAQAQSDVTVAAIAFDAEGRIVDARLDVAQIKVPFNDDFTNAVTEGVDLRSKVEKGAEYGMVKASEIGVEFDEQTKGFMEFIIGMTADEVANIATKDKGDGHHTHLVDDPELATTTTIDIKNFMYVVEEAWANAIDVEGAEKIGLGLEAHVQAKEAKDGKPARAQVNTYTNVIAFDADGKIVGNIIDTIQAKVDVDAEGKIVEKFDDIKSKKELKEEYDMKKASAIGKEWYEQMAAFEEFTLGKTVEEVQGIPVKVANDAHQHVPDLPELESTVTITVEDYLSVMGKALENSNK